MLAVLSEKHERFVRAFVDTGSARAAARIAGFSSGYAHELMHTPVVEEAILAESIRRFSRATPGAISVITNLMVSARSEKVKLDAAKAIIERALGGPVKRVLNIDANDPTGRREQELLAEIDQLARDLGLKTIDVTPDRSAPAETDASTNEAADAPDADAPNRKQEQADG